MFKIIFIFILCKLCESATDDVKILKSEVSLELEEHIIGNALLFLEQSRDLKVVANNLKATLNQKYGLGWQCLADANYDFGKFAIDRDPNTLLWFSFLETNFYIFKYINAGSSVSTNTAAVHMKNVTLSAKNASLYVMNEYTSNTTIRAAILNTTTQAISEFYSSCDFNGLNSWGSDCLETIAYSTQQKLVNQLGNYNWIVEVGDKYSKYIRWANNNDFPVVYVLTYRANDLYFTTLALSKCN